MVPELDTLVTSNKNKLNHNTFSDLWPQFNKMIGLIVRVHLTVIVRHSRITKISIVVFDSWIIRQVEYDNVHTSCQNLNSFANRLQIIAINQYFCVFTNITKCKQNSVFFTSSLVFLLCDFEVCNWDNFLKRLSFCEKFGALYINHWKWNAIICKKCVHAKLFGQSLSIKVESFETYLHRKMYL